MLSMSQGQRQVLNVKTFFSWFMSRKGNFPLLHGSLALSHNKLHHKVKTTDLLAIHFLKSEGF